MTSRNEKNAICACSSKSIELIIKNDFSGAYALKNGQFKNYRILLSDEKTEVDSELLAFAISEI